MSTGELDLRRLFAVLHIAFRPSGTQGYSDLRRDATGIDLYDVTVEVASLRDVVRSKQAANRPKDQRVLPVLRELLTGKDAPDR